MKAYEESLKTYRDQYSVIETARKERAIEIAKCLKQKGVDLQIISETTGLTKEEIEKL